MGIEQLKGYQTKFNSWVKCRNQLKPPVCERLAASHMVADGLSNGSRLTLGHAPRPEAGNSAAGRYSYLVPLLRVATPSRSVKTPTTPSRR